VIYTLLNGIEFGIVLAFLVGPVFFAILQASVEKGFWVGVLVAVGVSISDVMYVLICYFGLSAFVTEPEVKAYMGIAGGLILLGFGSYYLFVKSRREYVNRPTEVEESRTVRYIVKGFLINSMSPLVPVFWIGAVSVATVDFGYSSHADFAVFFTGVLATALLTDIGKAYLAGKLRELITHRLLVILNVTVGLILIVFGGRLIYSVLQS